MKKMKIKVGDLTVRQLVEMCKKKDSCDGCPFGDLLVCPINEELTYMKDKEIEVDSGG